MRDNDGNASTKNIIKHLIIEGDFAFMAFCADFYFRVFRSSPFVESLLKGAHLMPSGERFITWDLPVFVGVA